MEPESDDTGSSQNLSYLCSREYEDYLDWLENQNRQPLDLFKPFRLLGGLAFGMSVVAGAVFLMS
jgi:hypothetical protein